MLVGQLTRLLGEGVGLDCGSEQRLRRTRKEKKKARNTTALRGFQSERKRRDRVQDCDCAVGSEINLFIKAVDNR